MESLTEKQQRTLITLVDQIIPPSDDGRLPGAAEAGCAEHLQGPEHLPWIRDGLDSVVSLCHDRHGRELCALTLSEQAEFVAAWRRKAVRFSIRLANQIIEHYYQNDQVLKAIGLPARPPFPEGYVVDEGDLMLLEPVYERGKLYRD